jgi:dipeptidyl aminopeptidase/acylaminoacyl peptidase
MKKQILSLLVILVAASCTSEKTEVSQPDGPGFTINLTEEEKTGGVLTPELMWKFGRLGSVVLSPDGTNVLYSVTAYDLDSQSSMTNICKVPVAGGDPVQLTTSGGSSPQWTGNGSFVYVSGGKLISVNADGSGQKEVGGLSDFEIFSVSPDGKMIYFTRRVKLDQTANEKHNFPKANVRIINDLMYRHWNSWHDYSYSHLFVASFDGSSVSGAKDIMEGQRFESPDSPYFDEAEIAWSPDGRYIAYTSKRLAGTDYARSTNTDIYLYDVNNGSEVNITKGNMGYDRQPVFSPDGTKIAYSSMEEDGYESDLARLFVYDIAGKQKTWVTKGWDYDVESIKWQDNQNILFSCSYRGTAQIFRTSLADSKVVKITEGIHNLAPFDFQSGVLVSGVSSMSLAPEVGVADLNTGQIRQITSINKPIYEFIKMGRSEERYIKTRDNKDLQMWIIYPPDFDASKKYPALLFCLGGPQSALDQFWSYRWNMQMMAAKGYIVIAPNRRGVKGFGQEWKEQISGNWHGLNMQDYLDATDAMAAEPFVDKARMAAVGASYGGYSVYYLAGIHAGRFKAFISHNGTFNLESWYGSTEELWFPDKDLEGPYWNKPQSYKFSPHLRVDSWDTPILIIAGRNDFRIPYTQGLEAFQAAQLHGVPSRLLFFEDEYHFVTKPQNAVIWQREFFEWLETYLR